MSPRTSPAVWWRKIELAYPGGRVLTIVYETRRRTTASCPS